MDADRRRHDEGRAPGASLSVAISITHNHLLDGRVRYAQPAVGFRSGIEPVLLAAAVPAQAGERVLEGGAGAGAALLCLAARVPGVGGLGVERDCDLVAIANLNARANGAAGLEFIAGDITAAPEHGLFDHAMANPPYHRASGTVSPVPGRSAAKRSASGMLHAWAGALAGPLRHRGTLTFILPAASIPECFTALRAAGCAASHIMPLWPRAERPAKLALVRSVKGGRSPLRLLPGLVLHEPDGRYTAAAEAVLRNRAALEMA